MTTANSQEFWNGVFAKAAEIPAPEGHIAEALARLQVYFGDLQGKRVLDVGCGLGTLSLALAKMGADVTAIDTSEVAVSKLNQFATEQGLSIKAHVANALQIEALGPFDAAAGFMILHHIEPFPQFAASLARSLKPGAKAFFYENNAASKILIWCRNHIVGKLWVPKHGDADEFPLQPKEIDALRPYFVVRQEFPAMFFFQLVTIYILRDHIRFLMNLIRDFDNFLYRRGWFVRYSYLQHLLLQKL